jgi:hypothetical protein
MSAKRKLTTAEIDSIVQGLDPVDWIQIELLAKLPASRRIIPPLQAQEFSMAALHGTFRKRFPTLSMAEINMKVLAYLTPVRMGPK